MSDRPNDSCRDCGASVGEHHDPGCDVERCMLCGWQRISCDCVYDVCGISYATLEEEHPEVYCDGPTEEMEAIYDAAVDRVGGPEVWTGEWPGAADARRLGLFSRWVSVSTGLPIEFDLGVPGKWQPCAEGDVGAGPDLNKLNPMFCRWSVQNRRWEKP